MNTTTSDLTNFGSNIFRRRRRKWCDPLQSSHRQWSLTALHVSAPWPHPASIPRVPHIRVSDPHMASPLIGHKGWVLASDWLTECLTFSPSRVTWRWSGPGDNLSHLSSALPREVPRPLVGQACVWGHGTVVWDSGVSIPHHTLITPQISWAAIGRLSWSKSSYWPKVSILHPRLSSGSQLRSMFNSSVGLKTMDRLDLHNGFVFLEQH